jgi:hypothetical protein
MRSGINFGSPFPDGIIMKTAELIDDMASQPAESTIDLAWLEIAQNRLDELRAGRTKVIPGEAVFERIRQLYAVK